MRKGLGIGKGKGYYNIIPIDRHIHSLSAKGVKSKRDLKERMAFTKAVGYTEKDTRCPRCGKMFNQLYSRWLMCAECETEKERQISLAKRTGTYWAKGKSYNPKSYFNHELKKEHIKPFNLPVQTAILVPSTKEGNKKISRREFEERILNTRKELSKLFGGFTSVTATGGYEDIDTGDIIKERVNLVVAYADTKKFKKKADEFIEYVEDKKKEWGQQSMGVIVENDLYYI